MNAWEQIILQELARPDTKRKQVAQTYAVLIAMCEEEIGWSKINHAIIERWSMPTLIRIKKMAWSGKCFERKAVLP